MNLFDANVKKECARELDAGGSRWRRVARCWILLLGGVWLASCGGEVQEGTAVGGETHFLVTCGEGGGCGLGLSCIEGVCTRRCEPGFSSCSEFGVDAACMTAPGDEPLQEAFAGRCDVSCGGDADCAVLGAGYACVSGACRAQPEARQAELSAALSTRSVRVRAVDSETCQSGLRWVGGEHPSAEMLPGSDCVGCHRDTGARPLVLGGTLYAEQSQPLDGCFGLEGVELNVVDAEGREFSLVTNRAGNFYLEGEESEFAMPYRTLIPWTNSRGMDVITAMFTMPSYGGCARCHGASDPPSEYVDADPNDPEFAVQVPVIFLPGFP